jgi:hypothetical protein
MHAAFVAGVVAHAHTHETAFAFFGDVGTFKKSTYGASFDAYQTCLPEILQASIAAGRTSAGEWSTILRSARKVKGKQPESSKLAST